MIKIGWRYVCAGVLIAPRWVITGKVDNFQKSLMNFLSLNFNSDLCFEIKIIRKKLHTAVTRKTSRITLRLVTLGPLSLVKNPSSRSVTCSSESRRQLCTIILTLQECDDIFSLFRLRPFVLHFSSDVRSFK